MAAQFIRQGLDPRFTLAVGQGNSGRHARPGIGRVEVVGVQEFEAEVPGEFTRDRGLAAAGDSDHDDGAGTGGHGRHDDPCPPALADPGSVVVAPAPVAAPAAVAIAVVTVAVVAGVVVGGLALAVLVALHRAAARAVAVVAVRVAVGRAAAVVARHGAVIDHSAVPVAAGDQAVVVAVVAVAVVGDAAT